ncbi:sulfate permease, SulP family [Paenibacillus sp. 1_12]|uniref:SulP family inorganic anion transporter n=1 Tax=Paenibacillus sp. 1_12 TaxID=1566278 RepID=UPI0008E5E635|nr:SulP family inorganic anion transporter [Paenibacillus sp. 1_12]SFM02694.1 sulfate permease, SulP family [Paenibacillus sp. 1_12]
MFVQQLRQGFFGNVRNDVLSGITVALALIPEAIAFSIMAGVDPMVGLYASFTIAVTISIVGGRPGMISAATGAMASLMGPIIVKYGLDYLFAATVLTGLIQLILGVFKVGRFITFVPHSVIIGFVNALAIIIFMAQLPNFVGESWPMYAMVAGTLAIIYVLPLLTKVVPSALVAIIVMTIAAIVLKLDIRTVGDMGEIRQALPLLHIPQISWSWHTLLILLPYSLALAIVGLTESLLTATIVDEMTETGSDKNREVRGQGIANMINGLFGGMAGCAMIGQTVINIKSGGRTRLSTLVSGLFLLFLILVLGDIVKQIPMAALVGVMFMVSIGTFDWGAVRTLGKIPRSDAVVMVLTVAIVVATSNLAIGVVSGVVLSALNFGWRMAKLNCQIILRDEQNLLYPGDVYKEYVIGGPLFFGTMTHFIELFEPHTDPERIVINLKGSHIWDHSAVTAITKVSEKYRALGKKMTITGINPQSRQLMEAYRKIEIL